MFIRVKITSFKKKNSVGKFVFKWGERWAMWENGSSQHHWLVCVVNFLLPSAPRSSIDSLLSEARVICITYSPRSLPVASSTVYSERSRPSWIAQLLGHVDSPVHGWALIALVYAGSGCVQASLLSVPSCDNNLWVFLFLLDLQRQSANVQGSWIIILCSSLKYPNLIWFEE